MKNKLNTAQFQWCFLLHDTRVPIALGTKEPSSVCISVNNSLHFSPILMQIYYMTLDDKDNCAQVNISWYIILLFAILKHNNLNPHSLPLYGKEQHEHALKSLLLCSTKERKSYMFEMTWRWVNDDRMFLYDSRRQPLTSIEWGGKNKQKLKLMATVNCLLTNVLHNIFSCVQQKKEAHTGLEQVEDTSDLSFLGELSLSAHQNQNRNH